MPESAEELYRRALGAADADGRLSNNAAVGRALAAGGGRAHV